MPDFDTDIILITPCHVLSSVRLYKAVMTNADDNVLRRLLNWFNNYKRFLSLITQTSEKIITPDERKAT